MAGVAGPILRFEPVVPAAERSGRDERVAVLDMTWTPTPEEAAAGQLISIRDVAAPILASVDLLSDATRLLDEWVGRTSVIDDMTIDGTSIWYYVRLHDHSWLQQRMMWTLIVDSIVRSVAPSRIEIADGADPVLVDVARLVGARGGIAFQAAPADPSLSRVGFGLALPEAVASRSPASPTILERVGRRVRAITGGSASSDRRSDERRERRQLIAERLERLAAEPEDRLLVVLEHARQRVETAHGPRDINPYLGPIVDRLRGGPLDPIEVELSAKVDDDVAWSRLVAPDGERLLPASVIWQGGTDPDEDVGPADATEGAVDAIAGRIARSDTPLIVAGVDLGPLLAAHVAEQARNLLPRKRRAVDRIRALIRRLHPAGILLADEYHRQDWLIAAAAEHVPVAAVQHGILYPAHNGYVHATRPSTLRLPDRTYVFGRWERDVLVERSVYRPDEVVVGGSPRLDLVRPGATDRQAVRSELGVAPGNRMVVVSGTHNAMQRRFHLPVALSMLTDRPLPGIHLVVKQHPGERDEGQYRAVVEGAAAARGQAPPPMTLVQKIDLYRLLAAADAHIGIYSTVLTEAVMTGTTNLMFAGLATADLLGYEAAGVAVPVRSAADVLAALDRAHAEPLDDATRQAFLDLHFEPGSASERIAADLVSWFSEAAPAGAPARVLLRPVEPADEALLLGWANDPGTRAGSRRHALIPAAEHARWLARQLATPDDSRLWIGESEGAPIGLVRFERRTESSVEVGITVAPDARGRGLARPLLDAGIEAARAAFGGSVTILADILPGNRPSLALFTGAGFRPIDSQSEPAVDGRVISLELR